MTVPPAHHRPDAASLTMLFNKEAHYAVASFSRLKGRLAIVDCANHKITYACDPGRPRAQVPYDAALLTYILDNQKDVTHTQALRIDGLATITMAPHVTTYNAMFGLPGILETITILDHEIGHFAVNGGMGHHYHTNFKECCADVFALLRAAQRHPQHLETIAAAMRFKRTFDAVFKDRSSHFTVPALLAAEDFCRHNDVASLSPEDIAQEAYRLAIDHAPNSKKLENLSALARPVAATYDNDDSNLSQAATRALQLAQDSDTPPDARDTAQWVLSRMSAAPVMVHGVLFQLAGDHWAKELSTQKAPTRPTALSGKNTLPGLYQSGR